MCSRRFPIPDLRADDDMEKPSYWTRNVRHDSVVLNMKKFVFSTTLNSAVDVFELDTKCQEVQLFHKVIK
jgi:hypothetical protein